MPSKETYRKEAREYRFSLTELEVENLSSQVVQNVLGLPEVSTAHCIHCYWPIKRLKEIDTRPLIQELTHEGKLMVIPAVSLDDPDDMIGKAFEPGGETQLNRWGTLEPVRGELVDDSHVDLVIVPALCADRSGFRIGYGKGFYDRFLARTTCPTAVLVYSENLHTSLPHFAYDRQVDIVITEHEVLRAR